MKIYISAGKGAALAMSGQAEQAFEILHRTREEATAKGHSYVYAATDIYFGAAQALKGDIGKGARWIEDTIQNFEREKYNPTILAIGDVALGEIYLSIVLGVKVPLSVMIRNAGFLIRTLPFAAFKAEKCFRRGEERMRACENTSMLAWALMDLGVLAKAKRRQAEARAYLEEAIDLADSVDAYAIADKSKAALRDLD